MDEENFNQLDELTLNINLELNILYNALKYLDFEELDITAVSCFVKRLYKKSDEIRKLF